MANVGRGDSAVGAPLAFTRDWQCSYAERMHGLSTLANKFVLHYRCPACDGVPSTGHGHPRCSVCDGQREFKIVANTLAALVEKAQRSSCPELQKLAIKE